jgi:SAM-dependent methyltransferase
VTPPSPKVFDPAKAARLDDPDRLAYLGINDVERALDIPRAGIVLDYGAGTGFFALPLAERRRDITVIAFDREPKLLEILRAKPPYAKLAGRVRTASPSGLPNVAGRCARVLLVNVLHELEDEHLDEIREALAPDGFAVAIDWDAAADRPIGPRGDHVLDAPRAALYLCRRGFTVEALPPFRYQFALRFRPSATSRV